MELKKINNKSNNIGFGLLCMGTGFANMILDIDSDFHYLGCGSFFGVDASLPRSTLSDIFKQTEDRVT